MTTARSLLRCRFRLMAGVLLLHVLAAVMLSVMPDLHALMHDHAHEEAHVCAVSEFHDGSVMLTAELPFCTGRATWARLLLGKPQGAAAPSLALRGEHWERGPPRGGA